MDFNLLNLLWSVLVLPIGWFAMSWIDRGKRLMKLESEVKSLSEKVNPLNEDIKLLTKSLSDAELAFEKKMYSMAIEQLKNK